MPDSVFERHAQSAVAVLLLGVLAWVGIKVTSVGDNLLVLTGDVRVLSAELQGVKGQLEAATNNRYTAQQAAAEERIRDAEHADMARRLNSLEEWAKEASKHISGAKGG